MAYTFIFLVSGLLLYYQHSTLKVHIFPQWLLLSLGFNHLDVARLLLNAGADADVKNRKGDTPLLFAAREGLSEAVRLLLTADADKDMKDASGRTALGVASCQKHFLVMRLLSQSPPQPQ